MNKLNKTAYMLLLWVTLCVSGCAGKSSTPVYLEAKTRQDQNMPSAEQTVSDSDDPDSDQTAAGPDTAARDSSTCFVFVCGAVKHPGVFELPKGSRIYEAIALAGGLRKDAYTKGINQAQQIQDGDMIEVLTVEEYKEQREGPETSVSQEQQTKDGLVDINTASEEELMTLNGIGQSKAANIIAYRESSGGFSAPEEIMNVNGIGEGVYAKIKDKIKVIQ